MTTKRLAAHVVAHYASTWAYHGYGRAIIAQRLVLVNLVILHNPCHDPRRTARFARGGSLR